MNYVNYNVPVRTTFSGEELYQYTIPSAISYWQAEEGQIAQKAILGIRVNSKGSGNDLIVVPRLLTAKDGAMVDYQNSKQISKKEYATEASKDVNKYDELYGYQKVKYGDGSPVIMKRNEKAAPEYVYKLVNLYGDGRYTSEYYRDTNMPSQLENGTVKPKEELTDQQIINHLGSMILKPINETETSEVAPINEEKVVPSQQTPKFEVFGNDIIYTEDGSTAQEYNSPEEAQEGLKEWLATDQKTTKEKINIYAGARENAGLSNFANRPFTLKDDEVSFEMGTNFKRSFYSVEQAFQYIKSIVAGDPFKGSLQVTEKIANETSGAKLKALGSRKSLSTYPQGLEEWDSMSETIMYELLLASFKQNPNALAKLLATGNAELTHTQDKGKWGTEFPKLLMEVRNELTTNQPSTQQNENWEEENNDCPIPF
jgi:predicted NAD-dependent protein-ADP-ribosyltransferase YbiA (DUF1768 family)